MRRLSWAFVLFFSTTLAFGGELRLWHAASGPFKVEAEFVSQTDTLVVLKKSDGSELKVPKDKLSAADVKYLGDLAIAAALGPTPPATTPTASATPTTPATASSKPAAGNGNSSWAKLTDPAVPEAAGTDYAALVKELMSVPETPTFSKLRQFKLELPSPETAMLAEGGRYLCTHDEANKKLDVWDLNTGKVTHTWNCGALANPRCFAISPTGKSLAIGREDQMAVTYDIASGKQIYEHNMLKRQEKRILRVALNWEDTRVYFIGEAGDFHWFPITGGKGKGGSLTMFEVFKPWQQGDKDAELRVSGRGAAGMKIAPNFAVSFDMETEKPFWAAMHFPEPMPATAPLLRGIVRWDPKYQVSRLNQTSDEKGERAGDWARSALSRTLPEMAAVDRAEKYIWCYGQAMDDPAVDIYSLDEFELPLTIKVPKPAKPLQPADREWLVPESRRIVRWCDADKQLTIFGTAAIEPIPSWKIHGTLHRLLLEKKYERLDALAEALQKERSIPGGTGKPLFHEIMIGFHSPQFYVEPWDWEQRLEAWVKERPKSTLARLALANHRVCQGWAARGSGSAASVTEEGWEKFRAMGELGEKLIKPLFDQPEPPADAFFLQLRIAKMLSWEPEKQLELAAKMLKVSPNHAPFHEEMVVNLLPRWYGGPGASGKYAEKVADRLGVGPGDYLYARMGVSLANYTSPNNYVEETGFDVNRILNALLLELNQNPGDTYQQMRFHGFFIYASSVLRGNIDREFQEAIKHTGDPFAKTLTDLAWNPYAVNQSKMLQQVFINAKPRKKN